MTKSVKCHSDAKQSHPKELSYKTFTMVDITDIRKRLENRYQVDLPPPKMVNK